MKILTLKMSLSKTLAFDTFRVGMKDTLKVLNKKKF
jgi:hypothetical protein